MIIDKRRDPKADTGLFELIYKQNLPRPPAYLGMNLSVRGRRVFKNRNKTQKKEKEKENENMYKNKGLLHTTNLIEANLAGMSQFPKIFSPEHYKGPVIADFIEELHNSFNIHHCGVDFAAPVSSPPNKKNKSKQKENNKQRVLKGCFIRKCKVNKSLSIPRRRKLSENKTADAEILCTTEWSNNLKCGVEKFQKIRKHWERETNSILVGKTIRLDDIVDLNKNSAKMSRCLLPKQL